MSKNEGIYTLVCVADGPDDLNSIEKFIGTIGEVEEYIAEHELDISDCLLFEGAPLTVSHRLVIGESAPTERVKRKYTRRAKPADETNGVAS